MTGTRETQGAGPVVVGPPVDAAEREQLSELGRAARAASASNDVVGEALRLAASAGPDLQGFGDGRVAMLWSSLATLGAANLTVARAVEPHLDALGILATAPGDPVRTPAHATWGVYAAEGPGARLEAVSEGDGWVLRGHKPWCSLAGRVTHALVTAWVDDTRRGLFAVDLKAAGVRAAPTAGNWVGHGLREINSSGVDFDRVAAQPVGDPGWYLDRPGFAWGGVGVAAVWFGGAIGVSNRVQRHVRGRSADQVAQLHVGQLDLALAAAGNALWVASAVADAERGAELDGGPGLGPVVALRARSLVAEAVETVIRVADHAMGPAPLAQDAEHAQRVSDLRLYVRQHHAERDVADLGRSILSIEAGAVGW